MPFRRTSAALVAPLLAAAVLAAGAHRQHGPHVHGEATLDIGVDGQLLLVSLDAPGMSLLGYEHPPRDADERRAYANAMTLLKAPAAWLVLPDAAGCVLDTAKVAAHGFGDEAAAAPHEHADFEASYRYTCHAPLALHALDVKLFTLFPSLHRINVDLVVADRQGSQALTPGTTTVPLSK